MHVKRCVSEFGASCLFPSSAIAVRPVRVAQWLRNSPRALKRWEHEEVLKVVKSRLDQAPNVMRIPRQRVEHTVGTLKEWMEATHFMTKGLKNASKDMSFHMLAYNMKSVMNILGPKGLIQAMRT